MSYVNFNRALSSAQIEALTNATNGKIYFATDGGIYVGNASGTADKKADTDVVWVEIEDPDIDVDAIVQEVRNGRIVKGYTYDDVDESWHIYDCVYAADSDGGYLVFVCQNSEPENNIYQILTYTVWHDGNEVVWDYNEYNPSYKDWQENDSSKPAYIENRTHYIDYIETEFADYFVGKTIDELKAAQFLIKTTTGGSQTGTYTTSSVYKFTSILGNGNYNFQTDGTLTLYSFNFAVTVDSSDVITAISGYTTMSTSSGTLPKTNNPSVVIVNILNYVKLDNNFLNLDKEVTSSSNNPVTSAAIANYVQTAVDSKKIFIAEYGVTTYAEIEAAWNAGRMILVDLSYGGEQYICVPNYHESSAKAPTYFSALAADESTAYWCCIDESTDEWDSGQWAIAHIVSPDFAGTPTAPTAAAGTNTTQIATTAFVKTAVDNGIATADAMIYKGTIAGGSTGAYGALTPAASRGWTYKVTTAGKIDGVVVEVGDMIICNTDNTAAATSSNYSTTKNYWDFIQVNIDGAVTGPASSTSGHIATFGDGTGKVIQDSGYTIATSVPSGAVFTDTKNTAGSTNSTSKLFLIGATEQSANPQTYSNSTLYIDATQTLVMKDARVTDNDLYIGSASASQCHQQYDATNKCLKFIFD